MAEFYAGCATADEMFAGTGCIDVSLVVELKHRFTWTVLQRAGSADPKASVKSNHWKYERCGLQQVVK